MWSIECGQLKNSQLQHEVIISFYRLCAPLSNPTSSKRRFIYLFTIISKIANNTPILFSPMRCRWIDNLITVRSYINMMNANSWNVEYEWTEMWNIKPSVFLYDSWWRHQMGTSSLALCEENPPVTRWIPLTKASDAEPLFISTWTNCWANSRYASYLRCHRAHYDVTVMSDLG